MGSGGHYIFSKTLDNLVFGVIAAAFLAAVAYIVNLILTNLDGFYTLMATFDLTPRDVNMIPFGALVFVVFWQLFDKFVFSRFLTLFEEREAAGTGAESSAESKNKEADELTQEFEDKLYAARVEFTKEKLSKVEEKRKQSADSLVAAMTDSENTLIKEREDLDQQAERLRKSLAEEVSSLSSDLFNKIKEKPTAVEVVQ